MNLQTRTMARLGRRSAGFTLLEVSMALLVLALVVGGIFTVMLQSERLFTEQVRQHNLDQGGRRVMERISGELLSASPPTILPAVVSNVSSIQYRKVTGFSAGAATLGPLTTLAFALAPGETANGVDDNGNGLADDGFLTYTETGWASPARLAGNLRSLAFNSTANGISFTAVLSVINAKNETVSRTFTQEVAFRNPD